MSTRLNDPKNGAKVIIMQRVHCADLAGHVLQQGGYEHLCLPAEYEAIPRTSSIGWTDPRKEWGELLWPQHFGAEQIAELKLRLGSYASAAQLQQRPSPARFSSVYDVANINQTLSNQSCGNPALASACLSAISSAC